MNKKYFFVRLNPARPDFIQTITDEERSIMQQHSVYWRTFMDQGKVVVFGPVLDPQGPFGMGVICVEDEAEVKQFIAGDPAGTLSSHDYFAMQAVLPQ